MIDVTKQFNEFFGVEGALRARQPLQGELEKHVPLHDPTHTPTSRGLEGPAKDPFDQYARTPVALYRDGRQYEADEMTAGATP